MLQAAPFGAAIGPLGEFARAVRRGAVGERQDRSILSEKTLAFEGARGPAGVAANPYLDGAEAPARGLFSARNGVLRGRTATRQQPARGARCEGERADERENHGPDEVLVVD